MGRDDGPAEFDGRRHDERVDGMSAGEFCASKECPSSPRDALREWRDDDSSTGKEMIDGSISSSSTTDFGQDRSRYANERSFLVSNSEDGAGSEGKRRPLTVTSQSVERFGIED